MSDTTEEKLNPPSGMPEAGLFAVGDRVKFVKARAVGSAIEFRTMEGKITEFSKPLGLRAFIKYHSVNVIWRKVADLRRLDQPSPLNALIRRDDEEQAAQPAGQP